MTCPTPIECGPESRRGCWVCQPDDNERDEPDYSTEIGNE